MYRWTHFQRALLWFVLSLFFGWPGPLSQAIAAEPMAALDLKDWDGTGKIELKGPWDFYWQKLLDHKTVNGVVPDAQVEAGKPWNGVQLRDQSRIPGVGYGTYALVLKNIPAREEAYFVNLPMMATSFRVLAYDIRAGRFLGLATSGQVGDGPDVARPSKKSGTLGIQVSELTDILFLIQVTNFAEDKGGLWNIPSLASSQFTQQNQNIDHLQSLISIGIATGLFVYLFMIWYRYKRIQASLWLACGAFTAVQRGLSTSDAVVSIWGESLYVFLRKMEVSSIPLGAISFLMFFYLSYGKQLLPAKYQKGSGIVVNLWLSLAGLQVFLILLTEPRIFMPLLPWNQIYVLVNIGLYLVILAPAAKRGLPSIGLSCGGTLCLVFGASFDLARALSLIDFVVYLTPLGTALFLIFQAQVIAQRTAHAFQESRRLAAELADQEKARTLFFQNTSHELRTPLNGILGFLDLTLSGQYGELPVRVRQQLAKAHHLTESLKFQVNTILDLAKFKQGQVHLVVQRIDLEVLKTELDQLAEGLIVKDEQLSYQSSLEASEPTFLGDREKIFTILRNLLGNAVKFRDPQRPNAVSLRLLAKPEELLLEVSDTGIGIPEGSRQKIFEEFAQVERDARRSYEGTGLGLTMVRDLVGLMGGQIELQSELGVGSRFIIRIPPRREEELHTIAEDKAQPAMAGAAWTSLESEPVETARSAAVPSEDKSAWDILVIDDHMTNCEVIAGILAQDGYQVRSYQRGVAGLQAMREKRPHVLLLDMMMPEMSGEDVLRELRSDEFLQEIPVILITARASDQDRILGLQLGADDYLAKPIFAPELRVRVSNLIFRQKVLREAERSLQSDKLVQLGEMFGELSHEIKNILHGSSSLQGLKLEDALLSTAVLSLEDPQRQEYAKGLVAPSFARDSGDRLALCEGALAQGGASLERLLRYSLVELTMEAESLRAVWQNMRGFSLEELRYASSQLKIFLEYKQLQSTVKRSHELTQSVLSFTREEDRGAANLQETWLQCLPLLAVRLKKPELRWSADIPPLLLRISTGRLMQILLNLVGNAIDAVQDVKPEDRWWKLEAFDTGSEILMTLTNGGPPIPKDVQARLFQRGYSTKGKAGSGIGLYVSHRLAQEAGGSLVYDAEASSPRFCFRCGRA